MSLCSERIASGCDAQFGYASDVSCFHLGYRLLGFTPHHEKLPEPFLGILVNIPYMRVAFEGAGINTEIGEFSYIRVSGCFKYQGSQRAGRIGL